MTLARRVIPCLDVAAGRVVKGVSFVNLVDAGDPAELAGIYDAEGADELVFLDITATVEARATLFEAVARTAEQVFIPLTVGGGVRTVEDVQRLLRAGADKVSVNSAAVRDPELLSAGAGTYGVQCMVLAIDARRRPDGTGWEVVVDGGRTPTGLDALAWAEEGARRGAGELLVTSMDADGQKTGYDLDLVAAMTTSGRPPRHRQRRRRRGRPLRRRLPGRRRRRPGGQRLPLRPALHRRGQAGPGRRRPPGPRLRAPGP